jgi:hypothetical protein
VRFLRFRDTFLWIPRFEEESGMSYEYDFEMVKRAYAEMARRAQEKDEVRRMPRYPLPSAKPARPAGDVLEQEMLQA